VVVEFRIEFHLLLEAEIVEETLGLSKDGIDRLCRDAVVSNVEEADIGSGIANRFGHSNSTVLVRTRDIIEVNHGNGHRRLGTRWRQNAAPAQSRSNLLFASSIASQNVSHG
jgi:hypothetical protein